MRNTRSTLLRLACGVGISTTLIACESAQPVGIDGSQDATFAVVQQCQNVKLDAVYSGLPARSNGQINLNDQWVFVEVNDVQRFILPRQRPAASDVRMGDDWATGTPAESYQILDINGDGRMDIRLAFSKFRLVSDGNLDQDTEEVQVWGLNRDRNNEYCGSEPADVYLPAPTAGTDVVVFNDINIFDNGALQPWRETDNAQMIRNLVTFTTQGPRSNGNVVMWDRGRNARCGPNGNDECRDANMNSTRMIITGEGMAIMDVMTTQGSLTQIPANVKSIWLWTPMVSYTVSEINALKQFAAEGGRIVFIGEWDGYYTATGIAVQNQFLTQMGAVMRNTGGAVDCGYTYLPNSSLREHQVTDDVDDLTIACASVIAPGPQDFVLFYDTNQTRVLAGVAKIDTTPISANTEFAPLPRFNLQSSPNLNTNSSTGR